VRLLARLGAGALLLAPSVQAADFQACAEIREYFNRPLPADLYAREQDLEKAVDLLRQHDNAAGEDCEDWIAERAYFELATTRHEFSRTFAGEPQALRYRSSEAAKSYADYLEWFLNLPEERRDRLIRVLTKNQGTAQEAFRPARRRWLRSRPGNVLMGLGAACVVAGAQDELLLKYAEYFRENVEIYPNQVAREWWKWLRALPDFKRSRSDAEIRALIAEDRDVRSHWEVFGEFLGAFVPANPSVRRNWEPVMRGIERWLAE